MTGAAQAAAGPPPPDPLLAAILAGHGAPAIYRARDPSGDFCVNASLFEAATLEDRPFLSRVLRSQDAARAGGRPAYSIPFRVVAPLLDTWQQVRRQVPGERRKLDPGVRARQRDRYKRAAALSLDNYARPHLVRDPRAALWRPRWVDHRARCHSARCWSCATVTIPSHRKASRRGRTRSGASTITMPAWLLDRAAALRACREAIGLRDRLCGGVLVVPQSCHVRTCPDCEAARQARVVAAYAGAVEALAPDRARFLTLTIRNVPRNELAAGLDRLSAALVRLQRRALWKGGRCRDRARCSMPADPDRSGWRLPHEAVTAALATVEHTYNREAKSWHPHAHLLIEGPYIPQDELARVWEEITGDSKIVWIESVRRHAAAKWGGDVRGALRELLKYAAKPTPAFLDPNDGAVLAELLVALRGRHLTSGSGTLYGRDVEDEDEPADLVLVMSDDPDADPYRAPRVCPLHGGPADWVLHGYLPRRDCRPVAARAGPRSKVLAWAAE